MASGAGWLTRATLEQELWGEKTGARWSKVSKCQRGDPIMSVGYELIFRRQPRFCGNVAAKSRRVREKGAKVES